ncbi:hypothetical protein [Sulfobacillus thermosulfidooxidans]|uniref:hypothetical protein n=1 Tax=Sulfobacillus thermosulfidooxidans TaxID=28034 RepID=UPI000319749E|nr:hypothetical protein [Sulfobacillus thermosulfidooxidans]OLZ08267.1 hypothetical protein BFX05_04300 [Sulfobacillus thermosulfidooxidans]OLZ13983.1 hypothetical protein BFX06_06640 [Sulfobacillus thermosulfidooxidans]OLZ19925.1 hypothetical protein BFX07_02220 [Sulfobacillus thermosulfidooxidans]
MNTSWEELLPLLLLGQRRDLLPLLFLLGEQNSFGSSESEESSIPSSFDAYLSSLVGDYVRVSLSSAVDNASTLVGNLYQVGSDFIVMRDVIAGSVSLGFRDQVIIPISNLVGIDRLPFFDRILPLIGRFSSQS